ncbi:uncharacterized protein LOC142335440 [Convolutriloba macropyga]|uniref:uncharacterized protein LOC142335440 n=1 Tax=Convolutriloba macropyga TaxID=536237 RepID=UPI003F520312
MGKWSYGLLNPADCLDDWKLCLLTYCCPFAPFGLAADKIMSQGDGYRCLVIANIPIVSIVVLPCWRAHIRKAKGVDGNFFFDCCAAYCCPCCTIYQGSHEAGVKGESEWDRTVEIMKRGYEGFDPKKEAERAKAQGKDAANSVS